VAQEVLASDLDGMVFPHNLHHSIMDDSMPAQPLVLKEFRRIVSCTASHRR
jgi:hypothetical protein